MTQSYRQNDLPQEIARGGFGIGQLQRRPASVQGRFQVLVFANDETLDPTAEPESICISPDLDGMYLIACSACVHTASESVDVEVMLCLNDTSTLMLTSTIVVNTGTRCSGDESDKIDPDNPALSSDCDEIIIRLDEGGDAVGLKVTVILGDRQVT